MWRTVCHARDLPARGGYLVELEGQEIALFRVGDAVHAIDSVCPHQFAPLAHGDLRGDVVYCPLHAWPFDVRTGCSPEFPGLCQRTFPARLSGDEVQIDL